MKLAGRHIARVTFFAIVVVGVTGVPMAFRAQLASRGGKQSLCAPSAYSSACPG
jgi:hypothetical protein